MTFKEKFKIFRELEEVSKKVNKIKNINRGGCCVYAYNISKILTKLKISHKVVVVDSYPREVIKSLAEGYFRGANHVLIYSNGFYIDSEGLSTTYNRYETKKKINLDLTVLKKWSESRSVWNPTYSTINNKKIEKLCNQLESV